MDPIITAAAIGSGSSLGSGILSFGGNLVSSAINASRSWKYAQKAMALQDFYNRSYTRDSYGLMREGLEKAGYNPLLALSGSANQASYSPSGINSDSDNGSQAITSALDAFAQSANIRNVNEQTSKVREEKRGIELDNRLKLKQLNTDPKAIVSDLLEGNSTPVTDFLHKVGNKLGISTGQLNSAVSSSMPNVAKKIILHDGRPYVQKGVPKSVVKSFSGNSAVNSQTKAIKILNSLSRNPSIGSYKHSEGKKYRFNNNKPPKNFPSGM